MMIVMTMVIMMTEMMMMIVMMLTAKDCPTRDRKGGERECEMKNLVLVKWIGVGDDSI